MMKPGDKVRLTSLHEIENQARRQRWNVTTYPDGTERVAIPDVKVGDVGTVGYVAPDDLFEVTFDKYTVLCNDAMVEKKDE
jgi:hypothetical protein